PNTPSPDGIVWDQVNYGCTYNTLFSCMYNIWRDHGPKWTDHFNTINEYNTLLANGFQSVSLKTGSLEGARDDVCKMLTKDKPADFPTGPTLTALDKL
ncbi:hypothetical protein C8J57DRAFT_966175, partial [Mycena rebaudengoi]